MKVLITGVAGFLGSHVADEFLKKNYEVIGIDNLLGGYLENVPTKVKFHNVDLGDFDQVKNLFEGVDLVVHSACTAYEGLSVFSPALVTRNTSHITTVALSASVRAGVRKFVHMSSMARYGAQEIVPFTENMTPKPQDPYGIAKLAAELLVRNICETNKMAFVILIPHNIIGPRQKYDDPYRNVASIMINRLLQNLPPIIYGDGSQKRCFSFIQDVIDPIMAACESDPVNGLALNIGPDEEFISINKLAETIQKIMGTNLEPIYLPGRPQEVLEANCSADLARRELGYETKVSLEKGLEELYFWIKGKGAKEFSYHLPLEFTTSNTPRSWTEKLI
jgi:UDP-glucose 4-epimerase